MTRVEGQGVDALPQRAAAAWCLPVVGVGGRGGE